MPGTRSMLLLLGTAMLAALPLGAQQFCTTTLSVTYSPMPLTAGQPITAQATIASSQGSSAITGTVSVSLGSDYRIPISAGSGTLVLPALDAGSYTAYASFAGKLPTGCNPPETNEQELRVFPPGGANGSLLSGRYAFLFQGTTDQKVSGPAVAIAGSVLADGEGKITSGEEDVNSAGATLEKLPVTGTYTVDETGRGTMVLASSQGTQHLAIFTATGQHVALIETDATLLFGNGTMEQQAGAPGAVAANGSYSLTMKGEAFPPAAGAAGEIAVGGLLSFVDGSVSADLNQTTGTTLAQGLSLVGTASGSDANGRFNFTLSSAQAPSAEPKHYVGYRLDANRLYVLSLEPHASAPLLSGSAVQ